MDHKAMLSLFLLLGLNRLQASNFERTPENRFRIVVATFAISTGLPISELLKAPFVDRLRADAADDDIFLLRDHYLKKLLDARRQGVGLCDEERFVPTFDFTKFIDYILTGKITD